MIKLNKLMKRRLTVSAIGGLILTSLVAASLTSLSTQNNISPTQYSQKILKQNQTQGTTWVSNTVYGNNLSLDTPSRFSNDDATNYVRQNKDQFFRNVPADFTDHNINVKIKSFDDIEGKVIIIITLSRYYDDNGVAQINPPKVSNAISLYGFKKLNPNKTDMKLYGLNDNRDAFWPGNPFTADILSDKTGHAQKIKDWINENRRDRIDLLLDNYDLNGWETNIEEVVVKQNTSTFSVIVDLTFNNVSLGSGENGKNTFSYEVNAKPTQNINITPKEYPDLSQEALEKLADSASNFNTNEQDGSNAREEYFKQNFAKRIYFAINDQVNKGSFSINIMNLIQDQLAMEELIKGAIYVESDLDSSKIEAAFFDPLKINNNIKFKELGGLSINSQIDFRSKRSISQDNSQLHIFIFAISMAVLVFVFVILIFLVANKQKKLQNNNTSVIIDVPWS